MFTYLKAGIEYLSKNIMSTMDGKRRLDNLDAIILHGHGMDSTEGLRKTIHSVKNPNGKGWPLIVYFNKESAL